MIQLSTVLQKPIEVEVDGKVWKFSYLTLGDYKAQADFVEIAWASVRKCMPEITREQVLCLPLDSAELIDVLIEVGGLTKKSGPLASKPDPTG